MRSLDRDEQRAGSLIGRTFARSYPNVGPHPDCTWSRLLRGVDRLRLRLRPALGGNHDLRLLAGRHRDRRAPRLPDLRPAQA